MVTLLILSLMKSYIFNQTFDKNTQKYNNNL